MEVKIDEKALTWITDKWEKKSTIILISMVIFLLLVLRFSGSNLLDISLPELIFIIGVIFLIYLIWVLSVKTPKNKKNHFGFCIAIDSETKSQGEKIKSDFIKILQTYLDVKNDVFKYNLIILPKHLTKRITNVAKAKKYLFKMKCHFMVYGFTRLREINGKNTYMLNLDALVAHRTVPENVKNHLEKEFGELFPRKLLIDQDNDAFKFEITTQWINIVSRYIIGIAFLISGFLKKAEEHFQFLNNNADIQGCNIPQLLKVKKRLPLRLSEINTVYALNQIEQWKINHEIQHLDQMYGYINKIRALSGMNYEIRLLLSIYLFVRKREIDKAILELKKCKNIKDVTWKYNIAFLYAYKSDLRRAKFMYKSAFKGLCSPNITIQTEVFIEWILDKEPDKIQFYYCLGLINWFDKGDLELAKKCFNQFIEKDVNNKFPNETRLSKSYLNTIQGELQMIKNRCSENAV